MSNHYPVPAGWKLVPVEPTKEMDAAMNAAMRAAFGFGKTVPEARRAGYLAAIAAAPQPPAPADYGTSRLMWEQIEKARTEPPAPAETPMKQRLAAGWTTTAQPSSAPRPHGGRPMYTLMTDDRERDMKRALNAIVARINGEWDHPDLMAFEALGNMQEDILRIAKAAGAPFELGSF